MNAVEDVEHINFRLVAVLKLSGELGEDALNALRDFVRACNQTLLKKGVPESGRGAEIVRFRVLNEAERADEAENVDEAENADEAEKASDVIPGANAIEVEIHSDRYVRAHDALLRFRRNLAGVLGRYRIGLRGIDVRTYEIEMDWRDEVRVKSLPFVKNLSLSDGKLRLSLELSEREIERRIPDRILRLLYEKREMARWGGKKEHWELLFESERKEILFDRDPAEEMIRRCWIVHGASRGQWIYGPQITRIFRAFERILMEHVCKPLGYHEMIFPKVVTWDVWKHSGHARAIYPEAYYVCVPKTRDPEYWEDIADYFKITGEVPTDRIMERIENIGGLCYAQCPPFWIFLRGKTIDDDCLPICVFDRSGTSHRYESGGIHGIERVDEFHRVELVFIGTKEQVISHAAALRERYRFIFEKILDIEWREAKVTPWFMAQEGRAGVASDREVGTVDYEALLPYSGKWLEFQNVSVNGDKYPRGFSVKLRSGRELWSGCSGVGLERWAAVFLAQKGLDTENWPQSFREIVGELPEVFKFV
ncbi:MAG: hypothetical protein N2V77_00315 [Canidatus Methanoxibalbensis ujae]|nr:hypothetical protein [Candidatus Methanoxibalbensis ujae]